MGSNNFSAICFSHIGKRENQEDNFLINDYILNIQERDNLKLNKFCLIKKSIQSDLQIYAICDGMGGYNAGETASLLAVKALLESKDILNSLDSLKDMISYIQKKIIEINTIVCGLGESNKDLKGMGSTLVMLLAYKDDYAIFNIGDSRAYAFNNGKLYQITKDHTEGQRMIDLGLLSRKEVEHFPAKKNLNRYIGKCLPGYALQADIYLGKLDNEIIMLCSDGVSDFVSEKEIEDVFNTNSNIENVGKELISRSIDSQYADNATLILINLRR